MLVDLGQFLVIQDHIRKRRRTKLKEGQGKKCDFSYPYSNHGSDPQPSPALHPQNESKSRREGGEVITDREVLREEEGAEHPLPQRSLS